MEQKLQIARFHTNLTEADLLITGKKMFDQCKKTGNLFFATISGYDEDPRELWEIPEAITFARLIRNTGVICLLEFATSLRDFPTKWPSENVRPFLGAFEMWTIADGKDILLQNSVDTNYVKNIIKKLEIIDLNFQSRMLMGKTGNKVLFEGQNKVRSSPADFEKSNVPFDIKET